jgi:hypothetical protein
VEEYQIPVKVLLRDAMTRLYLGPEMHWVKGPEVAMDLRTLEAAARKAVECGLEDMEVVLRYEEPVCELALNPVFCLGSPDREGQRMRV